MKKLFLSVAMLFSMNVFAEGLEWSDLELNQNYFLTQNILFTNDVMASAGNKYILTDKIPGGAGFPYMYFEFQTLDCKTPEIGPETGEHILQDHNGRNYKIMTRMDKDCQLSVYVHGSKYYEQSLFE